MEKFLDSLGKLLTWYRNLPAWFHGIALIFWMYVGTNYGFELTHGGVLGWIGAICISILLLISIGKICGRFIK